MGNGVGAILQSQPDHLADAQSGSVRGHQHRAMFEIEPVDLQQFAGLLRAIDPRLQHRFFHPWQRGLDGFGRPLQHSPVKETQRTDRDAQGARAVLLFTQQVQQVGFQFVVADLVRRPSIMSEKPGYKTNIGLFRIAGQAANFYLIDEFLDGG